MELKKTSMSVDSNGGNALTYTFCFFISLSHSYSLSLSISCIAASEGGANVFEVTYFKG